MRLFRFKPKMVKSSVFQLSLMTSIYWMAMALVETVWAVYLEGFLGSASSVGFVVGVLTLVGILTAFIAPEILSRFKDTNIYSFSLLMIGLSYVVFALTNDLFLFLVAALGLTMFSSLRSSALGIIFRDESPDNKLDQNEGMLYTMSNIGYLFGPIVAGYFSETMGIQSVFVLAAVFVFITLVRFKRINVKDVEHHTPKQSMFERLLRFAKSPDLLKAYVINGGMEPWWAIAYIFIPLMIIGNGQDLGVIGLLLFVMILPSILIEYPAMKYVKKFGYDKYFALGYAGLAAVSLALFFFNDLTSLVILFILAGIAIGFLEPTRETYFFRLVGKNEEENLYAPFMTATTISYAIMAFVYAMVINVASFNTIFLVGAGILMAFAIIGATAKKH